MRDNGCHNSDGWGKTVSFIDVKNEARAMNSAAV
jgi:hypothetical protein